MRKFRLKTRLFSFAHSSAKHGAVICMLTLLCWHWLSSLGRAKQKRKYELIKNRKTSVSLFPFPSISILGQIFLIYRSINLPSQSSSRIYLRENERTCKIHFKFISYVNWRWSTVTDLRHSAYESLSYSSLNRDNATDYTRLGPTPIKSETN